MKTKSETLNDQLRNLIFMREHMIAGLEQRKSALAKMEIDIVELHNQKNAAIAEETTPDLRVV